MSRREKLIERITAIPAPNDVSWDDIVTFMGYFDYELNTDGGGSHHHFFRADKDSVIQIPRPGKKKGVGRPYIKIAIATLKEQGLL